jgi:hypothetical protein
MASDLDSSGSTLKEAGHGDTGTAKEPQRGWLKMGAVAAASVLAGGLAAAWFYRKTLAQLRQAESNGHNTAIKASESGSEEDF